MYIFLLLVVEWGQGFKRLCIKCILGRSGISQLIFAIFLLLLFRCNLLIYPIKTANVIVTAQHVAEKREIDSVSKGQDICSIETVNTQWCWCHWLV